MQDSQREELTNGDECTGIVFDIHTREEWNIQSLFDHLHEEGIKHPSEMADQLQKSLDDLPLLLATDTAFMLEFKNIHYTLRGLRDAFRGIR